MDAADLFFLFSGDQGPARARPPALPSLMASGVAQGLAVDKFFVYYGQPSTASLVRAQGELGQNEEYEVTLARYYEVALSMPDEGLHAIPTLVEASVQLSSLKSSVVPAPSEATPWRTSLHSVAVSTTRRAAWE